MFSLAVDPDAEKLYWMEYWLGTHEYKIWRADLDGSHPELLVDHLQGEGIRGLSIDPQRNRMYWVNLGPRSQSYQEAGIYQASLDGQNVAPLVITGVYDLGTPLSTSVDETTGDVYYAAGYSVIRINPETKAETRVLHVPEPGPKVSMLSVSGTRNEIDFGQMGGHTTSYWKCRRDGGNLTKLFEIVEGSDEGENIVIDWNTNKAYYGAIDKVRRTNLDGTQREDLLLRQYRGSGGSEVAIDRKHRTLYFIDAVY